MAVAHPEIVLGVWIACAVVALILAALLAVLCCCAESAREWWFLLIRGGARDGDAAALPIQADPPQGKYISPLSVQLRCCYSELQILVRIARIDVDELARDPLLAGPAGEARLPVLGVGFQHYREPLLFVDEGSYRVEAHTLSADKHASEVQAFVYHIGTAAGPCGIPAPRIVPCEGYVTTATNIVISTGRHDGASAALFEELRYSVEYHDNAATSTAWPATVYTDHFRLTGLPVGRSHISATVRAIAVDVASRRVSALVQARLTVVPASAVYFDPSIPAPTAIVGATATQIRFEKPKEPRVHIVYRLEYADEARGKRSSRKRGTVFDPSSTVTIDRDVSRVVAWAVDALDSTNYSDATIYDVTRHEVSIAPADDVSSQVLGRSRSSKRRHSKHERRRDPASGAAEADAAENPGALETLEPSTPFAMPATAVGARRTVAGEAQRPQSPIIYVACSDCTLSFDNPPTGARILYTLNNTDPSPDNENFVTFEFHSGSLPLQLSRAECQDMFVTARLFVPIASGADGDAASQQQQHQQRCSYRYGDRFFRNFFFC